MCPFTHRFSTVEDTCCDPSFFETITNDKVTEHKYYYQIQGWWPYAKYLGVIVYTNQNFTVEMIQFNERFWDEMQPQLTDFFFKYILPKACVHNKDN